MNMMHTAFVVVLQVLLFVSLGNANSSEGSWGPWGSMSPCSVTCGSGTMEMARTWMPGAGEPESKEPFTSTQVFSCTNSQFPQCPRDGRWTSWGLWSYCSKPCGGGEKKRNRVCQGITMGGKPCEGKETETEECNRAPCPPLPKNFDMTQCHSGKNFTCASEKMCIPIKEKCDDKVQCHDGSDEENCLQIGVGWGSVRYDLSRKNNGPSVHTGKNTVVVVVAALLFAVINSVSH